MNKWINSLALIFIWGLSQYAYAQNISVTATVSEKNVFKGQQFVFQIKVEGSDQVQKPMLTNFPNFSIEFVDSSTNNFKMETKINGKTSIIIRNDHV